MISIGGKREAELWAITNRAASSTGTCIEAKYFEQERRASYVDEDGTYYNFDVGGFFQVEDGGGINLYYTDEISKARPQTMLVFWIACYVLFGALSIFCIWRIVSVYRKKKR